MSSTKTLDEVKKTALSVILANKDDPEIIELAIKQAMTKTVIETKNLACSAIIRSEKNRGDNMELLKRVEEKIPTSDISTDLIG